MKKIDVAISVMAGLVLGYGVYYYVLMELATDFFYSENLSYLFICIVLLIASISACICLFCWLLLRGVPKWLKAELTVCYFVIVAFCLFCRRTAESVFVWNPLASIADLKEPEMLFQSVLNFALFWPLGWYFSKRMPAKKALLWGAGISLALELLQWLLRRSYFDSLDALLYWAGIAVGYGQAKLFDRAFSNRKLRRQQSSSPKQQ